MPKSTPIVSVRLAGTVVQSVQSAGDEFALVFYPQWRAVQVQAKFVTVPCPCQYLLILNEFSFTSHDHKLTHMSFM